MFGGLRRLILTYCFFKGSITEKESKPRRRGERIFGHAIEKDGHEER